MQHKEKDLSFDLHHGSDACGGATRYLAVIQSAMPYKHDHLSNRFE